MPKELKPEGILKFISPKDIERNEDNPRIYFRPKELEQLLSSIDQIGIQVPLSVYKKDKKYYLIDGERRWKCALKLNLEEVPAYVRDEPTELDKILLMYNIHALREQWDLFTIAMKLPDIIDLLNEKNNKKPTIREIAKYTGLTSTTIIRCKYLINLPEKYKNIVYKELELPKSKQKLTEDFFAEMEKALSVVKKKLPKLVQNIDPVRDVLIKKYREGVIVNLLDLRKISKIVNAEKKFGVDKIRVERVLTNLFLDNQYSVNQAFSESAEVYYQEYNVENRIEWLIENIDNVSISDTDDNIKDLLIELRNRIDNILGSLK
jgi:ParB family transcriptional regulator, chromosome partitioning protein